MKQRKGTMKTEIAMREWPQIVRACFSPSPANPPTNQVKDSFAGNVFDGCCSPL
jgi:hypothetical protein